MRIKKICIVVFVCLLSALAACSKAEETGKLTLTMNGERELTVEYGQTYEDPGATAQLSDSGEPIEVPVCVQQSVDDRTLGSYLVKYSATYADSVCTAYRRVHIVDTQAPTITLVADPDRYTMPNETYQEEGFTAQDNHDGDLSQLVQRTETREKIVYTVTDSSGNTTTVERVIAYADPVPPELQLLGASYVSVTAGSAYHEPGCVATDNCDGDISSWVKVSGSVDIYNPGIYTLTYSVADSFGNTVSASRKVEVVSHLVNDAEVSSEKVIYLTFDDGPGKYTPELLDVLKKYNVKATFFVVNTKYIDTIRRAAQEGHTVAIHTATHVFDDIYASEEAYFADLNNMRDIISGITGITPTLLRFPGGSSNTVSSFNPGIMSRLTAMVQEQGYQYFDWNVDSKDAGGAKTADRVFHNVVNGIGNKSAAIVLQHDIKKFSIDAVERIINWGLANGYTFRALTKDSPVCHHPINN